MIKIKRLQKGNEKLTREVVAKFWPKSELNDECLKKETNYLLAAMKLYKSTGGKREPPDAVVFVYREDKREKG